MKVKIFGKDNTHSADLVIMPKKSKEGYQNILGVIDLYSRYGWCIPIKDKRQETLVEAFESYFEKDQRIP